MKDLCAELDSRIDKLQKFQTRVQAKLDRGVSVAHNTEILNKVNNSLDYAKKARMAMESSCCDYSCQYELHEV